MVVTQLPTLSAPTAMTTVMPEGKFHWIDLTADGQVGIADGKYRIIYLDAFESNNNPIRGGIISHKAHDGNILSGWGEVPSFGRVGAIKNFTHVTNRGHLDTFGWVRNPNTGVYTAIYTAFPGALPEGFAGEVWSIQGSTSTDFGQLSSSWSFQNGGPSVHLVQPHVDAPWMGPFDNGFTEGGVPKLGGGTGECSIVYEPDDDTFVIFFIGNAREAAEPNFGRTFRQRLGRAECPAAIFDTAPEFTHTPTPSATSWVWEPPTNGANGAYGTTNATTVWGTHWSTIHPNVSRAPDGVYHLVGHGQKPNTNQVTANNSTGIGHWWSTDKGFTWTADPNNPLATWSTFGFFVNGISNKTNSPHLVWDPEFGKVHLCLWGNNEQVRKPGTKLYALTGAIEFNPPAPKGYEGFQSTADRMLAVNGVEATLTTYVVSHNAATGVVTRTPTAVSVKASPPLPYLKAEAYSGMRRRGTAKTHVAALNLATKPTPGSQIKFGADVWEIVGVATIPPSPFPTSTYELSLSQ